MMGGVEREWEVLGGLGWDGWWGLMKEESVNYTTRSRPLYLHSLIAAPDCVARPHFNSNSRRTKLC